MSATKRRMVASNTVLPLFVTPTPPVKMTAPAPLGSGIKLSTPVKK